MELIPILSFIILVATLITFILAVGAYIIYKIRERNGRETVAQPVAVRAELVSPVHMKGKRGTSTTFCGKTYTRGTAREPVYAPTLATSPQRRPTSVSQAPDSSKYTALTMDGERYSGQKKFTRYPVETVTVSKSGEKKKKENESLRWR